MAIVNSQVNADVTVQIDTAKSTFQVTNNDPTQTAVFNVFDAATGTQIVWTFSQPPNSVSAVLPIPTVDNNNNPINWQVGQVATKSGAKVTTVTSPPWQITMQ